MEDIREWDLDFKILKPGGFNACVVQLLSDEVLVSYAKLSSSIHQEGISPTGYRTFVVLNSNCKGFWWLGHRVNKDDLLVFPKNNELFCMSWDDFEVYTISVNTELYDQMVNDLQLTPLNNDQHVIPMKKYMATNLRYILKNIFDNYSIINRHYLKQKSA